MAGVNKVILIGNLGADPEVRTLENGTKVARIRIATSESYTNKEGMRVENTEWHSITLWRQLADITEKYLSKGKQVFIEGKLQTRSWKDKEGNDRYTTEIVADKMQMLGRASSQTESSEPSNSAQQFSSNQQRQEKTTGTQLVEEEDDLPF